MNDTITTPFQFDETLFLWLTYTTETNQVWYITSDITRRTYQLWKGKKKTKWESDNPLSLYDKIK
jgi:hypothetical protein